MLNGIKQYVKTIVQNLQKQLRQKELKQGLPHVTQQQITGDLHRLGIQYGDNLFIHSSLKSLGYVEGGPKAVVQGLLDAVGPEGTLVLPTYYMPGGSIRGTCLIEGYVFDPRIHGTNMGALPETFLQFNGVCRSIHPTHSVSAIGKHAQIITESHHLAPSTFGKGSPWQRFHELNGKVLGIGISMGPVTYYHLLEDTLGDSFPVKVWEDTTYHIPCKGWRGEEYLVPVRPYRAAVVHNRIDQKSREDLREFFWNHFSSCGALHLGKIGGASSWFIQSSEFLHQLQELNKKGITIYSAQEQILQLFSR